MTKSPENEHLPKHVAIIMDGNGRWAKQRGLPRGEGHKQGAKVFKRICEYAADRGIRYVTFYAFSTENWRRPPEEVSGIMDLFREYLREAEEREQENAQKGLRIRYIGEREGLADDILELVDELERGSADKVRTTVNIAINYGGRNEILSACKRLAEQCARGERTPESLTEQDISDNSIRRLAEAKAQAKEPIMQGHDLTGFERYLPQNRHMIMVDILSNDSPVGYKGDFPL